MICSQRGKSKRSYVGSGGGRAKSSLSKKISLAEAVPHCSSAESWGELREKAQQRTANLKLLKGKVGKGPQGFESHPIRPQDGPRGRNGKFGPGILKRIPAGPLEKGLRRPEKYME